MNNLNNYSLGFIAGILAVIIWVIIRKILKKGSTVTEYDERQKIKRGEASSNAFLAMMIAEVIVAVINQNSPCLMIPFMWHMTIIFIGAAVFGISCVWKDAYFTANNSKKSLFISLGVVLVGSIIGCIGYGKGNVFFNEEGLLDTPFTLVIVCVMIAALLINILIKGIVDKKHETEDK